MTTPVKGVMVVFIIPAPVIVVIYSNPSQGCSGYHIIATPVMVVMVIIILGAPVMVVMCRS
jgi:hypothetical protein